MSLGALLDGARGYMYDSQGLEAFAQEVHDADEVSAQAVADYLAGHNRAIARFVAKGKPADWFWLEKSYVPAIAMTMKSQKSSLEVLGRGLLTDHKALGQLKLG